MKKASSKAQKEKFEEIKINKSSLIKLPGGAEIKIWFYEEEEGKIQTYMQSTVASQKQSFFVQSDVSGVHICWDRKALEDVRNGFIAKGIAKEQNAVGVVYNFKSKEMVQMYAVPLLKDSEKT